MSNKDNLSNSSSANWNTSSPAQGGSFTNNSAMISQMMSLRSLSGVGGGDAPPLTVSPYPKMRNNLFTISTRSLMASTSTTLLNVTHAEQTRNNLSSETDVTSNNLDQEIKETNKLSLGTGTPTPTVPPVLCRKCPPMARRRSYRSMDDLHQVLQRKQVNSRRCSAPNTSTNNARGQMIAAANELLVEENKHLRRTIEKLRRTLLVSRISTWLALEAVRRKGKAIDEMGSATEHLEQKCAARLILHSLLLNSWRHTRHELDSKIEDNSELRKSVENLALQVQVLRHVQTNERQKSVEKGQLLQNMKEELGTTTEENKRIRKEIEKMENELNSLQASTQTLLEENGGMKEQVTSLMDKKQTLLQSLEKERRRSDQLEEENEKKKNEASKLEAAVTDLTEQKSQWEERARSFESESWELKLHVDTKEESINELTSSCDALRKEKRHLLELKSELESTLERTSAALEEQANDNDKLNSLLEAVAAERDSRAMKVEELEGTLERSRREFVEVERQLLSYKLANVRKRRDWGNALYFVVSPMEVVRRRLQSNC